MYKKSGKGVLLVVSRHGRRRARVQDVLGTPVRSRSLKRRRIDGTVSKLNRPLWTRFQEHLSPLLTLSCVKKSRPRGPYNEEPPRTDPFPPDQENMGRGTLENETRRAAEESVEPQRREGGYYLLTWGEKRVGGTHGMGTLRPTWPASMCFSKYRAVAPLWVKAEAPLPSARCVALTSGQEFALRISPAHVFGGRGGLTLVPVDELDGVIERVGLDNDEHRSKDLLSVRRERGSEISQDFSPGR